MLENDPTVIRRRTWQAIPVVLPGKSNGQEEAGGLPFTGSESDTTEETYHAPTL